MLREPDSDIRRAIEDATEEADMLSEGFGGDDPIALQMRRIETVLRRLAREAGYDLSHISEVDRGE